MVLLGKERSAVPKAIPVVIIAVSLFVCFFHLITAYFGLLAPLPQCAISLCSLMVLGYFYYPLGRKTWEEKLNWYFLIDLLCILFCILVLFYIVFNWFAFIWERSGQPNTHDLIVGTGLIILLLELGRRSLGLPMILIACFFLLQNIFAPHYPGWLKGPSVAWNTVIEVNVLADHGIFGVPMGVVSSFIMVFVLFGSILLTSGVGDLVNKLALAIAGRFTGGPAKVAVIASAILGATQGVAASNVVTTGSFTIPLMKKTGYQPHFAGAVETVASTGGQIAPPIMGVAAFLMAEFLSVPYLEVAIAAVIPTAIYYTSTFVAVHMEAKKIGLKTLTKSEIPPFFSALSEGWIILVPIILILYLIIKGFGLTTIACYAVAVSFLVTFFNKKTWMTPLKLLDAFVEGARLTIIVALACSVAGLIIGTFYVSGLGHVFSMAIVSGAQGSLLMGLVLTAIVCIILGMAMPTVAVYITLMIVVIPSLIKLGCDPFAAHFFVFFMGNLSCVTPPVAVPAFAAASIAGSSPMQTAVTASRIAAPLYIVPFFFPYYPAILWHGPLWQILLTLILTVVGAGIIASGLAGWLISKLTWVERIFVVAGGLFLIVPMGYSILVGFVMVGIVAFLQIRKYRIAKV